MKRTIYLLIAAICLISVAAQNNTTNISNTDIEVDINITNTELKEELKVNLTLA